MRGSLDINSLGLRHRIEGHLATLTVNGCENEVYVSCSVDCLSVSGIGNKVILGPYSHVLSVSLNGIGNTVEDEEVSDTEDQLQSLPVSRYSARGKDTRCSICLTDFTRSDPVKRLPCLHYFHPDCIDNWLRREAKCPLCLTKAWD